MPKMKTKRGARKRLKRTGSGKLMRAGGWKQHKLEAKDMFIEQYLTDPLTANEDHLVVNVYVLVK